MDWLWLVAGVSCVVALAALATARALARRLEQLSDQYWELKFEHGELKARVKALAPTPDEQVAAQPPVRQTFVPLSSVKRSVS